MTARIIICGTELAWNVNAKTAKKQPFFDHSGDYAKRVSKVCKAGAPPAGVGARSGPGCGVVDAPGAGDPRCRGARPRVRVADSFGVMMTRLRRVKANRQCVIARL